MRKILPAFITLCAASYIFGAPGDIIDEFTLTAQPDWGVYGLAKDWTDGNIWAVGMDTYEFCKLGKFDNNTHNMIMNWAYMDMSNPPVWVMDIGFPYEYGGTDCIAIADAERPEIRMYDPISYSYMGDLPNNPYSSGFNTGLAANPIDCHLYCTNYYFTEIREWNCSDWNTLANFTDSPSMGVAYGWDHIFISFQDPFKILVFQEDGTFVEEYDLAGWTHSLAGICCAHENAVGENESLYITWTAYAKVREVEIGNFAGTSLESTSFGAIKHLFYR